MIISKYVASLSVSVDKKSIALVDTTLNRLEQKLRNFGKLAGKNLKINFDISSFTVDQRKLNAAMGLALDIASTRNVFQVSRFTIDQQALNRSMSNATQIASRQAKANVNVRASATQDQGRITGRHAFAAGGVGGMVARGYGPAIAVAGGAYGVGWLNKRNQEVQSAELGANAVVQGGRGAEAMAWLKSEADRIGFDWLQLTPSFTGFMGAAQGTMGYEGSLNTFKAFNEFATSRHAPTEARKKALYGLQQMASMPNLMSQELFLQVGEAQGFGEVPMLFAQAYAEKMNSGLTGKEALYALKTAMKKGAVKTADVLPRVTELLSQKAAPTLAMSAKSSMSEQSRYNNALNEQVVRANKAGVETGYARLFRAFTDAMKESTPVVEGLAKTFDEISKYTSFAMLLPQSFKRAFEGRDSWVADALGEQNTATAKALYEGMKELGGEITKTLGVAVDGWKMIFAEFGDEMLSFVNGLKNFFLYTVKAINAMVTGDFTGATNASNALRGTLAGKSQEEISALASGGGKPVSLLDMATGAGQTWAQYTPPVLMAGAVKDAYGWAGEKTGITPWAQNFSSLMDKGLNRDRGMSGQNTVAVTMDVKISAANPEDFNEKFQEKFKGVIESTLLQYGQKE